MPCSRSKSARSDRLEEMLIRLKRSNDQLRAILGRQEALEEEEVSA